MNAYVCKAEKMGVLLFESQDEDKLDRSMQPIYVKKQGTPMKIISMLSWTRFGTDSTQVKLDFRDSLRYSWGKEEVCTI